jgi:hypothetical protein
MIGQIFGRQILNLMRTGVFLCCAGSICVLTNMNVLLRRCNTVKARIFATRSGFVQTRSFGFFGKKPDNEDKIQLKKYIDGDASVALDRRRRRETIESRFPPLTSVPKAIAETLSTQPLEPPKYVLFLLKLKDAILMGCQRTEITTLSNGARVGTEENYSVSSSIALFFHAGTRFEQPHNYGISHLIERMAFKSTAKRTAAEVTHVLEDLGANVSISSTRELMTYNADILRVHVPTVMEVMADAIKNPQFTDEELAEQLVRQSIGPNLISMPLCLH